MESNFSMIEKIPPKGVSFSDLIWGLLNNQQTSVPRKFDKCSTQYGTLDSDDGFIDFKAK